MPVEKTDRDITTLVGQISSGEIKLPEIQRGYVWKPTQVARLVESLYRGYPTGSLLFWKTIDAPATRQVAIDAAVSPPLTPTLYLLDGQQRLTSLHRVLNDHPQAQVVFNVETEAFQNQSAATAKDPRWVKAHELVRPGDDQWELIDRVCEANPRLGRKDIGRRLNKLSGIRDRLFHMEILMDFEYEEVAQIFVRVNSGGRSLKTTDLALATLSARWPGILGKLEDEAAHWAAQGYGDLDVTFLTRALTGAVLGRGLSTWSHARLVSASDEELEHGWATVQRGLRHLVPLVKNNLRVSHSVLFPSVVVLLPLVVLLGERPDKPLDTETANGILYWLLVATIRTRYSGSTDTRLGQDIPAARAADPVRQLLTNLDVVGARVEVDPPALANRTVGSPYFFLSFLVAQEHGAKDWWYGTIVSLGAEGSQKLQYHHIHPQKTLKGHPNGYSKTEINDLANLAFISALANQKIHDRSPAVYFPELGDDELKAHLVPLDTTLRDASTYQEFLVARRQLLAEAMTALLDRFRPRWLDAAMPVAPDPVSGSTLEFTLYESSWDAGRILATATHSDTVWSTTMSVTDLESALKAAADGLDGDIEIGGEIVPVRVNSDTVEIPVGPFTVIGTADDWAAVMEREHTDAQPISQCPTGTTSVWEGERTLFPVNAVD